MTCRPNKCTVFSTTFNSATLYYLSIVIYSEMADACRINPFIGGGIGFALLMIAIMVIMFIENALSSGSGSADLGLSIYIAPAIFMWGFPIGMGIAGMYNTLRCGGNIFDWILVLNLGRVFII